MIACGLWLHTICCSAFCRGMHEPALLSAQALIISLHHKSRKKLIFQRGDIYSLNFYYKDIFITLSNSPAFSEWLLSDCLWSTCVLRCWPQSVRHWCRHSWDSALIITVRMSQIKISSHVPFVWMVLHFYHSHMEPVWPNRSRTGFRPPVTSQPLSYLPHELWLYVSHMGHMTTRVLPHSTSSLQLTFCFVSVHLLLIRQLFARDFLQTFAVSGLRSESANGLSLSRLSGENRIHMGEVMENVGFVRICWWGVTFKQEEILKRHSWNVVLEVRRMLDVCFWFHTHVGLGNFKTRETWYGVQLIHNVALTAV